MKMIAIAAASALLLLGTAHAQQARSAVAGGYVELGYTHLKISDDQGGSDARPGALRGFVGYDVHPNVAVEGMLALGVRDDRITETVDTTVGPVTVNGKIKLKNAIGLYVKPKMNVTEAIEIFGRLGYTRAKFEGSASATIPGVGTVSATDDDSESGASIGFGANYRFSPNVYVGLDYMRYIKKDGVKTDGITLGLGYRF